MYLVFALATLAAPRFSAKISHAYVYKNLKILIHIEKHGFARSLAELRFSYVDERLLEKSYRPRENGLSRRPFSYHCSVNGR